MNTNIVLIGPVGAGKSTQGRLVAKALGKRLVSLDRIAREYYEANGFDESEFQKAKNEKGFLTAYRLWWPSLAYAAQQVVKDYSDCVIDFGAGHSHYEDESLLKGVKEALGGCKNVVLLLPAKDLDQSVSLLKQRSIDQRDTDWVRDGYDFIEHWVKDDCNHDLATTTVYTDGKTPEQTCTQILKAIGADSALAVDRTSTEKWLSELDVQALEQRISPIVRAVAISFLKGDYETFQKHHYPIVAKAEFQNVAAALKPYGEPKNIEYLGHVAKLDRMKLLWKITYSNSKEELLCNFDIELHGNDEIIENMGVDL